LPSKQVVAAAVTNERAFVSAPLVLTIAA